MKLLYKFIHPISITHFALQPYLLTLSMHALEGYSSHSVCLSVCLLSICLSVADLKDGGLLVLQRDTNLKSMTI